MRCMTTSSTPSLSCKLCLFQWHQALGFSRHVVYMRAMEIQEFITQPAVEGWIRSGHLLLVLWEVGAGWGDWEWVWVVGQGQGMDS